MAVVVQILTAAAPDAPMNSCASARAVPGRGLEGDRYFLGAGTFSPTPQKPDFELTLIESEAVEDFARASGLPFTVAHARRNLVTRGVALNDLVGKEFLVGSVRLRGVRLCEPCHYLARTTWPEVLRGLVHRGGLRAQIVSGGEIQVGAPIRRVEASGAGAQGSPPPHELAHAGYWISDDPARLDVDAVHAFLVRSYWAAGIPREVVARSLAHSLCLGIYAPGGAQVGLVRVVSDYATFAYLCDVYVLEGHRGRGLSKAALRALHTHPRLQGLRRFHLVTQDAHGLYEQFGFRRVDQPERHMEKRDPAVYVRAGGADTTPGGDRPTA
jgi:GNAT superfamily N-acetyltransferase